MLRSIHYDHATATAVRWILFTVLLASNCERNVVYDMYATIRTASSLFVGEYELFAVAALQLTLVQTCAVVGVDAVAVCHEEDHIAGIIGVDLLELFPDVADPLVTFGAPVTLQQSFAQSEEIGRTEILNRYM